MFTIDSATGRENKNVKVRLDCIKHITEKSSRLKSFIVILYVADFATYDNKCVIHFGVAKDRNISELHQTF